MNEEELLRAAQDPEVQARAAERAAEIAAETVFDPQGAGVVRWLGDDAVEVTPELERAVALQFPGARVVARSTAGTVSLWFPPGARRPAPGEQLKPAPGEQAAFLCGPRGASPEDLEKVRQFRDLLRAYHVVRARARQVRARRAAGQLVRADLLWRQILEVYRLKVFGMEQRTYGAGWCPVGGPR